ncbi:uncharacterized protein LOC113792943 [Dermatophagoides pteronyssinus]|uniref:uncharacterized protein LOC113792943 n=1 Tax=Dermatophagoides pteronyssinus TaxID=6956 RepID=UPI003F67637C
MIQNRWTLMIMIIIIFDTYVEYALTNDDKKLLTIIGPEDGLIELSTSGTYSVYVSNEMFDTKCIIYLIAPIDKTMTVELIENDDIHPCARGSYIVTFDGWSYYDQTYPAADNPGNDRAKEFCNNGVSTTFINNAGMIMYRFKFGGGFTFRLKFNDNQKPHSIFISGSETSEGKIRFNWTRNLGNKNTIYILQTALTRGRFVGQSIKVTSMKIGYKNKPIVQLPYSCRRFKKNKIVNYVEIGGWGEPPGFHTWDMTVSLEICSHVFYDKPIPIFCPNIGIRLHIDDSNAPDQYIEFTYRPISEQFYNSLMKRPVKLVCPKIPSDFWISIPIRLDSTVCQQSIQEPGYFVVDISTENSRKDCSIFIQAPASFTIEIEVDYLNLGDKSTKECRDSDFINLVDGWYYDQEFLPHPFDHKDASGNRMLKICDEETFNFLKNRGKKIYRTSQNIGQIYYHLSIIGPLFSFTIRFLFVKEPCNVIYAIDNVLDESTYLTRNYRQSKICATYFVKQIWNQTEKLYGILVNVLSYNIGGKYDQIDEQDLIKHSKQACTKCLTNDWAEIGGGVMFGISSIMHPDKFHICNQAPIKTFPFSLILRCQNIAMRLISLLSYRSNNFIQFSIKKITKEMGKESLPTDNIKEITCFNKPKHWVYNQMAFDPDHCVEQLVIYEGLYGMNAMGSTVNKDCSIIIVANSTEIIEITVDDYDMDCDEHESYLKFFDGWIHNNNEIWPNEADHKKKRRENRYESFCNQKDKPIRSQQNIVQIFYRIKQSGRGFRLRAKFIETPEPCNRIIRARDHTVIGQTYVMETVKSSRVCTILIVDFPWDKQSLTGMVFQITNLQVKDQFDTCIADKAMCSSMKSKDYIKFYGDNRIDFSSLLMKKGFEFCFDSDEYPVQYLVRYCRNMAVRMMSSGQFINHLEFKLKPIHSVQSSPTMPFGEHIPYYRLCQRPKWTKPKLKKRSIKKKGLLFFLNADYDVRTGVRITTTKNYLFPFYIRIG